MPPFDPASYLPRRRSPLDDFLARMGEAGGPYAVPNLAPTLSESPAPGTPDFMGPQAPTTLQNMQGQYNREFINPPKPTFKQTLLEGIREFAPVAIGGLLGGEAGAAGAAGGVQQANLRQQQLQEERRKEFARAIEEQKGREQQLAIQNLQQQFQQAQQQRAQEAAAGAATTAFGRQQQLLTQTGEQAKGLETLRQQRPDLNLSPADLFMKDPAAYERMLKLQSQFPKPDTSISELDLWRQQHPNEPIENFMKAKAQYNPAFLGYPTLAALREAQTGQIKEAAEQRQAYTQERAQRTINDVDEILPLINNKTAGAGSLLANVPLTGARTLSAKISTLKSNITQNELAQMR